MVFTSCSKCLHCWRKSSAHPLDSRHSFHDGGWELWGWLRRKTLTFGLLLQSDSDPLGGTSCCNNRAVSWGLPCSHSNDRQRRTVLLLLESLGPLPQCLRAQLHGTLPVDPPCRTCCERLIFLWTQHSDLPWEFEISTLLRVGSGSPTSCHVRVINTFLSIMHAGGGISNIWLDNKSIPLVRERPSLWPSGYLLFLRNELLGIFCWWGGNGEDKGNFLVKMMPSPHPTRPTPTHQKSQIAH